MNSQIIRCFLLCSLGLASASLVSAQEKKLNVIASFLPLYAHTKSIAGDLAEVSILVGKETGPHDYELKPGDIQRLAKADLFISNGVGLEEWLEGLIKKTGSKNLVLVDSSLGVQLLDNPKELEIGGSPAGAGHEHAEGKNPHIWLDPQIARQQVETITEALCQADPGHARTFRKNAGIYLSALEKLDEDFDAGISRLPNKNLVTFHDAFPYLARRYGLNYIGFVEEFPEKEPRPRQLASLVKAIRSNQVKVIFAESGYSPKLLESIATQSGASVASLNTLEVGAPSADAYLTLMRENLHALEKAWK